MTQKRDYYEVLEVDRSATVEQIAQAYRKMALKHHPDRNPGDDAAVVKFKEAAEAFEVLGSEETRARYDRYGHAGLDGAGGAPHFQDVGDIFQAFGDIFGQGLFGDVFGRSRGGSGGGRRVHRGGDVQAEVKLDLIEAAHGAAKTIRFRRHQRCATCNGSGAKPGTHVDRCQYCGGQGRIVQSTGIFSVQTTCPSCQGRGKVVRQPCTACRGAGYVLGEVANEVQIPAGVDDGTQLRIQGEGDPSPDGGPAGDCYCVIRVAQHPLFERKGQHLICQIPISYSQAVLGTTLEVPTLDGRELLEIPRGTQSGECFTLRGRGMPDPRQRGRGDLLVQVHIDVPRELDPRHDEALRALAEIENTQVSPKRLGFFEKVKQYFQPPE